MSQHKHRHRKSFLSSVGYYILVDILIVCLAMMVKVNRSKRAERDDYKATLSKQETVVIDLEESIRRRKILKVIPNIIA